MVIRSNKVLQQLAAKAKQRDTEALARPRGNVEMEAQHRMMVFHVVCIVFIFFNGCQLFLMVCHGLYFLHANNCLLLKPVSTRFVIMKLAFDNCYT